ncbi:hypothetical protein T492DRAFT_379195 [Pavlovales sp. CCMP2436]|nr:hypothetical protein T492DRAFT_379195 [Pavlovales sp. CCMP2436]
MEQGHALPLYRKVIKRTDMLRLEKVFSEWDTDFDGQISLSEFFLVMRKITAARQVVKRKPLQPDPPAKLEAMFAAADLDGSGYLDFPEVVLFTYTTGKTSTYRSVKKGLKKRLHKLDAYFA